MRVVENIPGTSGVSGSSYLAEIHFRVIGLPGDISPIHLHNCVLGDKNAQEISATLVDSSLRVVPSQYNLTINSTAGGNVTTPGEGTFTYNASEVVSLVATADSGYQFVNWTGDVGTIGDVDAASTNITMNGSYSITANFAVAQGWGFEIQPDVTKVGFNQDFTVNVAVVHYAGEADSWKFYIPFNTSLLEVIDINEISPLPTGKTPDPVSGFPKWNNTEGWLQHQSGLAGGDPNVSSTFVSCTITFRAKAVAGTAYLNFTTIDVPRKTTVILVGADVLNQAKVVNGTVEVVPGATLQGRVTFVGRGTAPNDRWIEPFVVKGFQPGNLTNELWNGTATTNDTGVFTMTGLTPGTYDIGIKNWTCLSKLVTNVTLTAGKTTVVDFGTMREGDCNGDDWVTLEDRSLLYAGWDTQEVIQGGHYCDLNRDGWLTLEDRSLMYANWDQGGDLS
jgi:hypothetical protein